MAAPLLQALGVEFGLGRADLLRIILTSPARYRVYRIPKRNGDFRTIAQPSKELKEIQRFVLRNCLAELPVHAAAVGYAKHKNISTNARAHVGARDILKLDFREFFPSIKVADWERYAASPRLNLTPEELRLYSLILFWGNGSGEPRCLSIGAPTSPMLSNLILFDVDEKLTDAANHLGVVYTRYADDITVSAPSVEHLLNFEKIARSTIQNLTSPRLTFNDDKRGIYTKGQRQLVTGLILTSSRGVSVGRERKRLISAMLHSGKMGKLEPREMGILKGWLGFCIANESLFVSRMRAKYGDEIVDMVLRFHVPRRQERSTIA